VGMEKHVMQEKQCLWYEVNDMEAHKNILCLDIYHPLIHLLSSLITTGANWISWSENIALRASLFGKFVVRFKRF